MRASGSSSASLSRRAADRLDLVVQEVDLPAALQLAQHRLADRAAGLGAHEGLDREAPLRRGRDHREIAQAFERHAQRARDRRGGERQHVDLGAHRLDRLLVAHAEAVFLVDHEQAEALELDLVADQRVRADDDVDGAVGQAFEGGLDLLGGAEARDLGDLDRPLAEAVGDVLVVLLRQQRGGCQDRDLLAAGDGDERGTQRDLGLAEADVAADEPVHRLRGDHVLDHRVDRGLLVRCLLEAEARREGFVVVRLEAERETLACGTARIQVQQLGGGVAHLLGGLAPGLVPLAGAEPVQRCFLGADAGVARDQMELRDRHVERGLVGVFEVQELAGAPILSIREVDALQARIAPDAVVRMHHRVADLQLRQVLDQRIDVADLLLLAAPARARRGREQLGLGDELDRRAHVRFEPEESLRQRRDRDREVRVAGLEVGQARDTRRLDPAVAQQFEQAFAPALGLGDDQHAVRRRGDLVLQARQGLGRAAVDAQLGQGAGPRHVVAAAQRELGVPVAQREEVFGLEEQLFRRQDRPLAVRLQEAMALARVGPELPQRLVDLAVQRERRALAEVVEDRRGAVEEQRQVVLDAAARQPGADVLVQAHAGRIAFQLLAPARAKTSPRLVVHRELAAGQQPHLGHRVEAALRVGVEGADRVDLVAEQVDAVGHRRAHREQVDQPAAHRVFARRDDLAHVRVAGQRELGLQGRLVELLLLLEVEGVGGEKARRGEAHQRGRRRHQHDIDLARLLRLQDAPQRREPLGDQVLVRREGVVGQRLPVGKHGDAQPRREEGQLGFEPLGVGRLGGDDRGDLALRRLRLREPGQQQRIGGAGRAGQREAFSLGDRRELHETLAHKSKAPRWGLRMWRSPGRETGRIIEFAPR